jgi:hypothetical protein
MYEITLDTSHSFILVLIFIFGIGCVYYVYHVGLFKKWVTHFIDWYIGEYHSTAFIHKDMIQNVMEARIKDAERILNNRRDMQEEDKLEALKLTFQITENGYLAELTRMEKTLKEVMELKRKVMRLYFEVKSRAKDMSIITNMNKESGQEIITNVSASLGKLETIDIETLKIVDEITKKEQEELSILQVT